MRLVESSDAVLETAADDMGYTIDIIESNTSFNQIGATYILTMPSSKRHFREEIKYFSPSSTNYIVMNQGYKTTSRELCKRDSLTDLCYIQREIMLHAQQHHPYENVCILEDDFEWLRDPETLRSSVVNINDFLNSDSGMHVDHYFLGCIVTPGWKYEKHGMHVRISDRALGAHAVIHTPKGMSRYIETMADTCNCIHIDILLSTHISYRYAKQLAYQKFEYTENQKTAWPWYARLPVYMLQLDKYYEPVWTMSYYLADYFKTLSIVLFACFLFTFSSAFHK